MRGERLTLSDEVESKVLFCIERDKQSEVAGEREREGADRSSPQ